MWNSADEGSSYFQFPGVTERDGSWNPMNEMINRCYRTLNSAVDRPEIVHSN